MSLSIADIRKDYTLKTLSEETVAGDPVSQFGTWFGEALEARVIEPNAMHLATLDRHQHPNARIVLLKSFDPDGFTFFTNYLSEKGNELTRYPFASLTFFWPELERQVRIQGEVKRISEADSDVYFQSRPRASQIGAWVSNQSSVIGSRQELEEKQQLIEAQFEGREVPRPPHWGGFRLAPDRVEFWQGGAGRLHDRILYTQTKSAGEWRISRLSP